MRTRLRGITGVMLLLLGSLLIIAGPAAADTSGDDVVEEEAVLVIEEQPAEEAPAPDKPDAGELSEDDQAAIQEKKDAGDAKDEEPVDDGKTDDEEPVDVQVIEETLLDEGETDDGKVDDGQTDEGQTDEGQTEDDKVDGPSDDELSEDDKAAIQEKKDAAAAKDEDSKDQDLQDEDPKDEDPIEYLEVMVVCEGDYDGEYDNDVEYEIIVEECDEPEFDPCDQGPRLDDDIRLLVQDCEPQKELVAICHVEHGAAFSYNVLQHVSEKDATWHLENHEDDSKVHQRGDCKPPQDVTICQLAGLDYKLWTGHPADANWLIANDGAVLTDGGTCPIRVCHFENTETFSYWKTIYANEADANWYIEAFEKDTWAIPGKPCPGNEDVKICHLVDGKYKLLQVTPDVGNWFLSLDNDDTVPNDDGKCPDVPKPEPTPDPTPDPTPEPTPDPTPEPTPKDDGTGGENTEPEVTEEPAEEEEEKKVVAPKPKDDDDSEVLAKTVTKETTEKAEELALTGTESGQLAMYGLALIAGGLMLMGTSHLRRITI